MRKLLLSILLLIPIIVISQNFNGEYVSYHTTFTDELNVGSDFSEKTRFNIAIHIEESNTNGRILIQDPRIPNKPLIYRVWSLIKVIESNGIKYYLFKCESDYSKGEIETISLHYSKNEKLNLMVSSEKSNQMFHDLTKG